MKSQTTAKIEIGQLIDERPLKPLQILVMVLSFLVVWLDGYHIQSMSLVVPTLAVQWSVKTTDFKLVVSSALIGILLGSAFIASMGDRWGRRRVLIISMVIIGCSSIGTGYATGMTHLVIWRFLTGLGLGASIPNATALTSDYVPGKRRAALVTLMFSGVSIGAFASGYIGAPIIEAYGWRGLFTVGGVVPLAMAVLLAAAMPESLRLLLARVPDDPRISKILARLAPDVDAKTVYAKKQEVQRQSVSELLSKAYAKGTLLLWFVFFVNMFILYLLVNWLPTLLSTEGWSNSQAMRGAVTIQLGGVMGGFILSWYVDRGKTVVATISAFALCAMAFGLFTVLPSVGISWWLLLIVVGGGISGAQFVLNALAAGFYPTIIRSTGVGWAFSVGRIGAVLSGFAGGLILERQVAPFAVLGMLVIPVVMCMAGVFMFKNVFQQPAPAAKAMTASSSK
jgi:AAHS family 4-hydroxybenzoate transporter-like MFS transporter